MYGVRRCGSLLGGYPSEKPHAGENIVTPHNFHNFPALIKTGLIACTIDVGEDVGWRGQCTANKSSTINQ